MSDIIYGRQMTLGRGVNGDTGKTYGTALQFEDPLPPDGGQEVRFHLIQVTNSAELSSVLGMDIAASFSASAAFSVSAELNLFTAVRVNTYYVYALIKCEVTNPSTLLRQPKLTPHADQLLINEGWDAFASAYGLEYVEGFVTGGSYLALIEIQTTSAAMRNEVQGMLSASYGPLTLTDDLANVLAQIQTKTAINVSVARAGSTDQVVSTDIAGMLAEARDFPKTVGSQPVRVRALVNDYKSTVPVSRTDPPDSLPRLRQRDTLTDLGRAYSRLRDYKAALEYILSRPLSDFDDFRSLTDDERKATRKTLSESLSATQDAIDDVVKRGKRCSNDYQDCQAFALTFDFLELPEVGGEMLTVAELETKILTLEKRLGDLGMLGGVANIDSAQMHRIDGNGNGELWLNTDNGGTVHVGAGSAASLTVSADLHSGNVVLKPSGVLSSTDRLHISGDEHLYLLNKTGVTVGDHWHKEGLGAGNLTVTGSTTVLGNLGTNGKNPNADLPPGWAGGVHTWDVFAEGTIGCGNAGQGALALLENNGRIYGVAKLFAIPHPEKPSEAQLLHGAIEGPELAVYYRGEGCLLLGCARVELPSYFEALTRPQGRTVQVTPISQGGRPAVALSVSHVEDGRFFVRALDGGLVEQPFYWEVKAVRADVEPLKVDRPKRALEPGMQPPE